MNICSKYLSFVFIIILGLGITPVIADEVNDLETIINSQHRAESNLLRDQYRHPQQTLDFMGIKPSMSVIEIWPGKGWYTEILAPWLKQGGGSFIAAGFPQHVGPKWRQQMQQEYGSWLKKTPELYDQVNVVELGPPNLWTLGDDDSVDAVLTFRNVHNWVKGGYADEIFTATYRVLKPGGVLGIVDHRAKQDTDIETMKRSGYLTENLVVELAQKTGFKLKAKSEVNANPLDDTQHPKGVWTLMPTLRMGDEGKAKYLAIGESDRFTLLFEKQ
jgi:predicted methyltransferase